MADAKALQQMLGVNPSAALKPSLCCANLVGRMNPEDVPGPYLRHYTCPPTEWDWWTTERWHAAADHVAAQWAISEVAGKRAEMVMGMFHNEGMGLQFSNRRHLYRCPEKVLWDAQHSIWASGGIAQYEINQLLQQAMLDGMGMPNIQAFLRTVHLPGRPHCTLNLPLRIAPG